MPYKSPCGFRDRIHVCKFKEEDCTVEMCDMYSIEWTQKGIMERVKREQDRVKQLNDKMQEYRKARKTQEPEYKEMKRLLTDLCYGCAKLSKAYVYLKRTKSP